MGAGDIETKAWRNTALVAVVVAVVAVTVAAISLTDDGGGRAGADRAPATASAATSRATTTITPQDAPADSEAKSTTMSGWGSFQPALMYAPVELGQTDGLTLDQHTKLGDQLVEVREAALNIGTVANAERLGYRLNGERWEGRGYEYLLWDQFSTFDINKPTMAVFPDTKPDTKIASVAYQVLGTREAGPPKVFDLSVVPWHHHFDLCKKDGQIVGSNKTDLCKEMGGVPQPQLDHWMVDFWVVPGWENPWGLVSSFHPDLFTENRPWDPEAAKKQEELKSHH